MTVEAMETPYAGVRFRSRLEARWALAFDQLGIPWEYEPEGYRLPSGPYLPDFKLLTPWEVIHAEVKPAEHVDDHEHYRNTCRTLSEFAEHLTPIHLLLGRPDKGGLYAGTRFEKHPDAGLVSDYDGCLWVCRYCDRYGMGFTNWARFGFRRGCRCNDKDKDLLALSPAFTTDRARETVLEVAAHRFTR